MDINKIVILILVASASTVVCQFNFNFRPIIGVLTQEPPQSILEALEDKNYTSFVAASYVKYIESAGGRVVPVLINQDDDYYDKIAASVNGFLFPGGGVSITNTSGYGLAGQKLFDYAVKSYLEGNPVPVWGTCLGFEMLTYLSANYHKWLDSCRASNKADKLSLQEGYMDSKIFTQMPDYVIDYARFFNTTYNNHKWCITPENFFASGLIAEYKMLATSFDSDGLEYVALIEHNEMPIFGSQFHPEKSPYEWATDPNHDAIPHDPFSIGLSHFFSNFFVNQARYNKQQFLSPEEEEAALIYNYDTIFTQSLGSSFTESYLFR